MKKTQKLIKCTSFALLFLFMLVGIVAAFPALDSLDGKTDIGETADAANLTISSITITNSVKLYTANDVTGAFAGGTLADLNDDTIVTQAGDSGAYISEMVYFQVAGGAEIHFKLVLASVADVTGVVLSGVRYFTGQSPNWSGITAAKWSTSGATGSWNNLTLPAGNKLTKTVGSTTYTGYGGNISLTFNAKSINTLYISITAGEAWGCALSEIDVLGTPPDQNLKENIICPPVSITQVSGGTGKAVYSQNSNNFANGHSLNVLIDGNKPTQYSETTCDWTSTSDYWTTARTVKTRYGDKTYGGTDYNAGNSNGKNYWLFPQFGSNTVPAHYPGRQYYHWNPQNYSDKTGKVTLKIDLGQEVDVTKVTLYGVLMCELSIYWKGVANIQVSPDGTNNKVTSISGVDARTQTQTNGGASYVKNSNNTGRTGYTGYTKAYAGTVTINVSSFKSRYVYVSFESGTILTTTTTGTVASNENAGVGYGMSEIEILSSGYQFDVQQYVDDERGDGSWDGTFQMSRTPLDLGFGIYPGTSFETAKNKTDRYVDIKGPIVKGTTVTLSDIKGGSPGRSSNGLDIYSSDSRIFKGYYIHKGSAGLPAAYATVKANMISASSPGTINITIDSQITVYLIYETVYNVTFDLDGGTGADTPASRDYEWSEEITAPTPTRLGYTFAGWKCAFSPAQGNNNNYNGATFNGGATLKNIAHRTSQKVTVTFTAQWQATECTLNLYFGDNAAVNHTYHFKDYDVNAVQNIMNLASVSADVGTLNNMLSGSVYTNGDATYAYSHAKVDDAVKGSVEYDSSLVISLYYTPCYKVEVNGDKDDVIIVPGSNLAAEKVQDAEGADYYFDGLEFILKIKWSDIDEATFANKRLKATSVITVNGQRVVPLTSVPQKHGDEYYIRVEYKNGLEYAIGKTNTGEKIQVDNADLIVNANVVWEANEAATLINNFAPLGVTTNKDTLVSSGKTYAEKTTMRFGTVWYIDDEVYQHTWVRNTNHDTKPVGMILLQPKIVLENLLNNTGNNGYYDYVMETKETDEWSEFLYNWLLNEKASFYREDPDYILTTDWEGSAGWEHEGERIQGIDWMVEHIGKYVTSLNPTTEGETTNGKSSQMVSFGGKELQAVAQYYYIKDVDGDTENDSAKFIEYSIVLAGIPETAKDTYVLAFPYLRVLGNYDPTGYPAGSVPSESTYNTYYYTYQAPIGAYTLNELIAALGQ